MAKKKLSFMFEFTDQKERFYLELLHYNERLNQKETPEVSM